jgi:tRNA U38,U39,U40 pseudouridine synthase TruA
MSVVPEGTLSHLEHLEGDDFERAAQEAIGQNAFHTLIAAGCTSKEDQLREMKQMMPCVHVRFP